MTPTSNRVFRRRSCLPEPQATGKREDGLKTVMARLAWHRTRVPDGRDFRAEGGGAPAGACLPKNGFWARKGPCAPRRPGETRRANSYGDRIVPGVYLCSPVSGERCRNSAKLTNMTASPSPTPSPTPVARNLTPAPPIGGPRRPKASPGSPIQVTPPASFSADQLNGWPKQPSSMDRADNFPCESKVNGGEPS